MLIQKGTQKIEVIVKKQDGYADKSGGVDADQVTNEDTIDSNGKPVSNRRMSRFAKVNLTHSVAIAKQAGGLLWEYYVGGLGDMHGDQAYQDVVRRNTEIVEDTTNFATSIAMGLTYGSAGGPVGMVLGAVFGAISSGLSIGTKYMSRKRDFNYKIFKEENSIEYKRARASINLTTGRLR